MLQLNVNLTKAAQAYSLAMLQMSEAMTSFSYSEDQPESGLTLTHTYLRGHFDTHFAINAF